MKNLFKTTFKIFLGIFLAMLVSGNVWGQDGMATIILTAGDVWGDRSGYQMLLDADATAYGTIIPETGGLTTSGDVSASTYAQFEYKIPENADGSLSTQNIVYNNSITILIPAGTYDWCITNPTPGDRMWIASSNGNVGGRADNYTFEAGETYEFVIEMGGDGHDQTNLLCNNLQCQLNYILKDNYGDGWNGAAIQIYDIDNNIISELTFDDGNEKSGYLCIEPNDFLRFRWVSGSWDEECSFTTNVWNNGIQYAYKDVSSGIPSFEGTVIGCNDNIMLPINLLEFSVEPRYDHQTGVHVLNLLTIRTGYEYNNCEFIVYRSEDAINWDYNIPVCKWDFGQDSAIYNEALDTVLNYFTIEHPNGQTYYPVDTIPYPVTYYKLIQRDCDNTTTEYTSEIIVCIANQQKHLIEPYVICDNGPQVVGGSEVCKVFVQNVLGQVVEEFQLQPYQQREVLAEIQGMYLITFVYKYNGESRKKTEKIICM